VHTQIDRPQTTSSARLGGSGAIVIGGDCGALGLVRSLGRARIPTVFLRGKNPVAAYSRYTSRALSWPGAEHPDAVRWLKNLASLHGLEGWTLFPGADEEVRLISRHHDQLSSIFKLSTPEWETTKWFANKSLTYQKAAELGIDYPRTYEIWEIGDLDKHDFRFPLVLKPAVKAGDNALTQSKVWRVNDHRVLARFFAEAVAMAGSAGLIVQELVPGNGSTQFSYAAVCQDGRPVLSMVARRLRQHPANYGTGTFVETVDNNRVEAQAERLLADVGYSGMVEMEFKLDARDNSYKLLDVNPRVWTWNSIGKVAGVDFPLTMWRVAQGETVPRMRARSGAYWMYLSRDFPEACREIFAATLSPVDYLRSFFKPVAFATFAIDDPKPWLADFPMSLKRWFEKGYRH
jgi:D-aspartate ligase